MVGVKVQVATPDHVIFSSQGKVTQVSVMFSNGIQNHWRYHRFVGICVEPRRTNTQ